MQDDAANPLKFLPPGPPVGFVRRPHLDQILAHGLRRRLILLLAPAGYGKTSLLASMAQEWPRFARASAATHLAWYQLDPSDDDAAVFLEGLVQAVQRVVPGFGRLARGALRRTSDARGQIQHLMAVFLDELREAGQGRIFLVLDNLHLVSDRVILESLERSLANPDSPLRLVISTRSDPRFYLSALRSQDALAELRSDDLLFKPEEVRELILQRAGRWVPQTAIDEVVRETGGWPSAASLAALIIARDQAPLPLARLAPTEHGHGRLVREVLAGFPPQKRELVARLSLLEQVDAEACREGAGIEDPAGLLRLVEEAGLPATRPFDRHSPLRLEPLFRTALERELALLLFAHERQALQRRAAARYAARGEWDEAVRRFLEAGAHEEAAAVVQRAADSELELGHLDTVLRWIRALPSPVRSRHPRLMVHEARLLLARDRPDEARVLLVAARPELEALQDSGGLGRRLLGWATMRLLEGRYPEARQSALAALEQLPEEDGAERAEAFWLLSRAQELTGDLAAAFSAAGRGLLTAERSGERRLVVRALQQAGRLAYLRGEFSDALALSGRAVQLSSLLGTEMLSLGASGAHAASVHLGRDQVAEAGEVAARTLEVGQRLYDVAGQVRANLALAELSERHGHRDEARERLERASSLAAGLPAGRPERVMVLQASAVSLLREGKRREALKKARQALEAAVACSQRVLIDQCSLIVAAAQMAGMGLPAALIRIRRLREVFVASDNRWWLSASLRLLAQGYSRLGLRWPARSNLQKSLALATSEGYVGMPLGLPSKPGPLLALATREGIALETAATLLGVDEGEAGKVLAPLLAHKNPRVRSRAEQVAKGMEMEAGRAPRPRLLWPGLEPCERDDCSRVSLQTLGGFHPFVGGQPVEWPSVDARDLAAYLVVNRGRSLPRDRVLRDLWPGMEEAAANLRLHPALYRLRETLGSGYPPVDSLLEGRSVYRWAGVGCSVDVETFRNRLSRARRDAPAGRLYERPPILSSRTASLLERAAALYHGEFLAGVGFEWCRPQREDLRAQLLWATRLLLGHHMAQGNWRESIRYGLQSLGSDPLQEDVVRDVMVCYYRIGDRSSILHQYREVKRVLAKERGVWPSEETRQLRIKLLGR